MTGRLVDPIRQGIAAPGPKAQWAGRAKPVPLAEAISMVDAWAPDFGFQLHQIARALRAAYQGALADWMRSRIDLQLAHGAEIERWTDRIWRACQAVPCSAGIENCHAPYYRHQPCCNLRVALWPGEAFETDHLPDSGEVHLFAPGRRNKPRVSAGCVKLVEPTEADGIVCGPRRADCGERETRPLRSRDSRADDLRAERDAGLGCLSCLRRSGLLC